MNNFTKQELEDIAEMMRHARKQGIDTKHNLCNEIEDKAWKLIENYCDHSETYEDYDCQPIRCKDCLEIVG